MPLYEVAILEKPTTKDAEDGKVERLILGPKPFVASDTQGAAISAMIEVITATPDIDRSRMQVLCRPFA